MDFLKYFWNTFWKNSIKEKKILQNKSTYIQLNTLISNKDCYEGETIIKTLCCFIAFFKSKCSLKKNEFISK